jgi:outer membrane protein TolC
VKNGYTVSAAEMGLRLAIAQKEQTINKIAYSVTQSYFNYKLANKLIAINDDALKLSIENKNAVDKRFELGMAAEIEVSGAELTVERMKTNKNMAIRSSLIAKENFMIALNYEKTVDFDLTDEIETSELIADVNVDIPKALLTRYDVLALKEKKDLDQLYFDITDKVTSENTASYKKANSALIDSKYTYTNGVKLIQ